MKVAEYQFGQTKVIIDDSCVAKTEKEKAVVMEGIRQAALAILIEEAEKQVITEKRDSDG